MSGAVPISYLVRDHPADELQITEVDAATIPPRSYGQDGHPPSQWNPVIEAALNLAPGRAKHITEATRRMAQGIRAIIRDRQLPLQAKKRGPVLYLERLCDPPEKAGCHKAAKRAR